MPGGGKIPPDGDAADGMTGGFEKRQRGKSTVERGGNGAVIL